MEKPEYTTLEGVVEHVTYKSEETGFTVLELNANEELICVVGTMLGVEEGEELKITGFYGAHATYGMQFKAQLVERRFPSSANAICKYLSAGSIKGIGPKTAKSIVETFKEDTLKILEEDPQRLSEVKGITSDKARKMGQQFKELFGVRALMMFLEQHNITPSQSVMIYKEWGNYALDLIKDNPYMLCSRDFGVDFSISDNIARGYSMKEDDPKRIKAALIYVLTHNLNNGFTALPKHQLLRAVENLIGVETEQVEVLLEGELEEKSLYSYNAPSELIYLSNYFLAQRYIVSRLALMLRASSNTINNANEIVDKLEKENNIEYATLQRRAIEQAAMHDAFILTGGPGTGKTTTINGVIHMLELQGKTVAIAAPTGRAAKRISEVTGREAKTIHRLLEVAQGFAQTKKLEFVHNEQNPIDADVVIIDEMSMVDTLLFDALLRGMKPAAKLIMVGDFHQLPSVGAGNILRDLIESDTIPMVELDHIFRQAAQSLIVTNAHAVVNGNMPELDVKDNDFFFLSQPNPVLACQTIVELCAIRLPKTYKFSPFDDIQVLCPQRGGEVGVTEINKRLQQALNPKDNTKIEFKSGIYTFRVGDKVMQIKNNYDIAWTRDGDSGAGIFNGDIGIIKMIDRGSKTAGIEFDGRFSYYSFDMANEQLELAYAITVHKSQGSEFEAIILPILGGYDKLYYRNLLYTAITRAKKILILIGAKGRIDYMVRNDKRMLRYTGLKVMLQKEIFDE